MTWATGGNKLVRSWLPFALIGAVGVVLWVDLFIRVIAPALARLHFPGSVYWVGPRLVWEGRALVLLDHAAFAAAAEQTGRQSRSWIPALRAGGRHSLAAPWTAARGGGLLHVDAARVSSRWSRQWRSCSSRSAAADAGVAADRAAAVVRAVASELRGRPGVRLRASRARRPRRRSAMPFHLGDASWAKGVERSCCGDRHRAQDQLRPADPAARPDRAALAARRHHGRVRPRRCPHDRAARRHRRLERVGSNRLLSWRARPETSVTAYQTVHSLLAHLLRADPTWNPLPGRASAVGGRRAVVRSTVALVGVTAWALIGIRRSAERQAGSD